MLPLLTSLLPAAEGLGAEAARQLVAVTEATGELAWWEAHLAACRGDLAGHVLDSLLDMDHVGTAAQCLRNHGQVSSTVWERVLTRLLERVRLDGEATNGGGNGPKAPSVLGAVEHNSTAELQPSAVVL